MRIESSYVFNHNFEDKYSIRVQVNAETSTEIIQGFVDFLKACQFSDRTILDGLEDAAMGLEENMKYTD